MGWCVRKELRLYLGSVEKRDMMVISGLDKATFSVW